MEADWEFEVGGDAPVIDACWPGLIDLQRSPERAWQLPETAQFPALAQALAKLNAASSPVWTSKCDLWLHLDAGEVDPDELDAPPGSSAHAMGCYIDLLPKCGQQWLPPDVAAAWCKRLCGLLRALPLLCCRVDLIIRRAVLIPDPTDPERVDLGVTAYLTSCGASPAEAEQALQATLAAFVDALFARTTVK